MKKNFSNVINNNDIDNAWNAMLLDFPKERLILLAELKKDYRLFLLSNTNEIHINTISKILENNYGFKDLSHLFEKIYYSYKIGLRKPDIKIFQHVLNENGLIPEETLFIDDCATHIDGAKSLGINAYLLKDQETILDIEF